MPLHSFTLNDGSGEQIAIPKDIADFLIQRQLDQNADNREFDRLQKLSKHLVELMEVIDSHDVQLEDCDRRGHLFCDCLGRKMQQIKSFLQSSASGSHLDIR